MSDNDTIVAEITIFDIAKQDNTLLYWCLYALTTGQDVTFDKANNYQQGPIISAKISAQMKNLRFQVFLCADVKEMQELIRRV